ncbi:MAG TPA: flagellar basal body P-ring protein FlgI, partial [Thauera aminoaromatica]|nr:flagellar basal body P-ring protein FlgI [Thauera aminoaromatica]
IDVTVSSIGNAKSLRGGTLVMTPLKGADGQVYAIAQGNMVVGGASAQGGGASLVINHLSAGRIPGGATVERAVPTALGQGDSVLFELNDSDFGTARRVVDAINLVYPGAASALDGRSIQVRAPTDSSARVSFLGHIENLEVTPVQQAAKVIVNSRTGSVVMNQRVMLQNCAVAHGSLTVTVNNEAQVSQPPPLSGGQTVVTQSSQVDIAQEGGTLFNVRGGANLADVVKALNTLGAKPMDLVSILQAMKAAGALRAELEVI